MKCTEFKTLNPLERWLAKWYYLEDGPHNYVVDDYEIMIWRETKDVASSNVFLKCTDCGQRKRIQESKYTKQVLTTMKKEKEVFTDDGATFKG